MTSFEQLPPAAREYLQRIEEFTGAKIGLISTGAGREATINRM
jgi:adenylosuccinate synthase